MGIVKLRQIFEIMTSSYSNALIALARPIPGTIITRFPDVLIPFECRLNLTNSDSGPLKKEEKVLAGDETSIFKI